MTKRIALSALFLSILLAAPPAMAQAPAPAPSAQAKPKGQGTPQTHHCYVEGKLQADLTHKKCTAQGGTWKKDVGTKEAPAATAPPSPGQAK
ncbi:MAG TPA: hypothetical protein VMT17_14510 [Anaeromyxobacteraceae bacterium]|nr:hypothetical protein [Anaeromyxobacteraceae bacterium]